MDGDEVRFMLGVEERKIIEKQLLAFGECCHTDAVPRSFSIIRCVGPTHVREARSHLDNQLQEKDHCRGIPVGSR